MVRRKNDKPDYKKRLDKALHRNTYANSRHVRIVLGISAVIAVVGFVLLNQFVLKLPFIPTFEEIVGVNSHVEINIENGESEVHFIDVGQGDCELILTKNKSVLIDSGEYDKSGVVIKYLQSLGIEKLDYVICTHPHSDHIGAMSKIVDKIGVDNAYLPKIPDNLIPSSSSLSGLLKSFSENKVNVSYVKPGILVELDAGCRLEFIAPLKDCEENLNNYSIVCRFVNENNKFLFTGDIEEVAELDIIDSDTDISADVIKVPHHGSNTSDNYAFIKAVSPKYAVFEVASPNDYGHPHSTTIKAYENVRSRILRTDICGNIVFYSTHDGLSFITEK